MGVQHANSSDISVDDPAYLHAKDALMIYTTLTFALCGTITNLTSISIFWKLGLKDSMSINVFALSVTDCFMTFLQTVVSLCFLADKLYPSSNIDAQALGSFAFAWMVNAMYLVSCWITVGISLERCFCVVFPFKVKQVFTRSRSVVVVLTIYTLHIGLHGIVYAVHKMEWIEIVVQTPASSNITAPNVRIFTTLFVEEATRVEKIFNIILSLVLGNVSFVIVIVCTVWMVRGLQATATIRKAPPSTRPARDSRQSHLSNKERKLVKVALALAITFSVCGLPRVVVTIVQSSIPYGHVSPIIRYTDIMWSVAYVFTTFGCSITICVYWQLNNNYRTALIRALTH